MGWYKENTIRIRLNEEIEAWLYAKKAKENRSVSDIIREILLDYIKSHK